MPPSSDVSELERPTSRKRWWAALRPAELIPNLIIGVVLGGLIVTFAISLATLIYGALLPEHLDRAIGLALFGTLAVGLLAVIMGSHPGVVIHMQDAPAAILAGAATGIVAGVVAGGGASDAALAGDTLPIFMTVAVTVALTTLVTGAVLLLFGLFRLGRMVRYLPFPVIGGFMAGTGWLLFSGGLSVMTSGNGSLSELLRAGSTANWLPGMAFAALLLYLSRAVQHYLIWPAAVVGAGAIFYVIAFAGGGDLDGWRANGYLLGPFPEADLAQGLAPADLALVHWPVVMAQLPTALTIAGISLLAVLLSSTAIEMTYDRRVDLNQELRTTGLGNLLAGTLGGQVGYHSLSLTALNARAGTGGRAPIVIALVVVAVALQFGAGLLDFVPTFLIGGLVAFLGMDFLYSWLVEEYRRLTNMEYAVVVVIVVLVGVAGFLAGVALGLFLTVVLFVVNYSRVDAVRHALSGAELHSRVRRDPEERRVVAEAGKDVLILQLQGFLFFGTANAVLERIQKRQEEGRLSAVILDFRRVTGVDASAAVALRRLLSRAVDRLPGPA
ncbi:MAG TPA: SulP family inorganic anion transporter, partial [Trueperaceae bacterium]|nr:SulP family inorganic anion transporter [Trueperaceae bacterium]